MPRAKTVFPLNETDDDLQVHVHGQRAGGHSVPEYQRVLELGRSTEIERQGSCFTETPTITKQDRRRR